MDPSLNEPCFIDSHAHVNLLKGSPDQLTLSLQQENIKWVLVPGFDLKSSQEAVLLAEKYPWVIPAAGIHPHDAFPDWSTSIEYIREQAVQHTIAAIGEIGLDDVRSKSLSDHQMKMLEEQLQIADEFQLPVLIHNREKDVEMERILDNFPRLKGILHCYSSPESLALKKAREGWFVSFSFNITYPKSTYLRELLTKLPVSSLLLETDSPYLSPLPDRGKKDNSPVNMPVLYQWVSEWLSIPLDRLCETLLQNFTDLFSSYRRVSYDRS